MRYGLQRLTADVMARLGETVRPQSQQSVAGELSGVPWPEDIIAVKVASLLGEVGARLISDAPCDRLGSGMSLDVETVMRMMPCGLYGSEVRLPATFLRLVSAKMEGWRHSAGAAVLPESVEWHRQWSAEAGIAGCPESPRAYLDRDGEGVLLRLLGSESGADTLEWLHVWNVPEADGEGKFDFPEALYAGLIAGVAEKIG